MKQETTLLFSFAYDHLQDSLVGNARANEGDITEKMHAMPFVGQDICIDVEDHLLHFSSKKIKGEEMRFSLHGSYDRREKKTDLHMLKVEGEIASLMQLSPLSYSPPLGGKFLGEISLKIEREKRSDVSLSGKK